MEKIKTTVIAWVSIYPAITLLLAAFGHLLNELPIMLRTLVLTAVLVPLMVYVLVPFWTRVFSKLKKRHSPCSH